MRGIKEHELTYFRDETNDPVAQTCQSKDEEDCSFDHNCGAGGLVRNHTLQCYNEQASELLAQNVANIRTARRELTEPLKPTTL